MPIIDHTRDRGVMLQPILQRRPDLVSRIKVAAEALSQTKRGAYAWPEAGLFPVDTPENTALSYLYVGMQARDVPRGVQYKVASAAVAWGLDIGALTSALTERRDLTKTAAPRVDPDDYALPAERRLRIKTADEVQAAQAALARYSRDLGMIKTASAAVRIVNRARAIGMRESDLSPATKTYAGLVACDLYKLADALTARAVAAPTPSSRSAYHDASTAAHALGRTARLSTDRATLSKIASHIDAIDQASGVRRKHPGLPDPLMAVFNTSKVAGGTIDLAGVQADVNKLSALDAGTFEDVLGPEFVAEITDASGAVDPQLIATVIPTLPLDMKRALGAALKSVVGV